MTTQTTKELEIKALTALVDVIYQTAQAAGSMGIPEGHLYAGLMRIPNFRVDHLNMILDVMEKAGKITRRSFVVRAVG